MTDSQLISSRAPEPVGAYPHAKRVGNLLFLSGIGPRKRGTKQIPGVTLDAQGNTTRGSLTQIYDLDLLRETGQAKIKTPKISSFFISVLRFQFPPTYGSRTPKKKSHTTTPPK